MNTTKVLVQKHHSDAFDDLVSYCQYVQNQTIKKGLSIDSCNAHLLSSLLYHKLKSDSYHAQYTVASIRRGAGILKSYYTKKNKKPNTKAPYVKTPTIDVHKECYKQDGYDIIITIKPRSKNRNRTTKTITLNKGVWGKAFFNARNKVGQLALNREKIFIPYSREPVAIEPKLWVGIDMNFDNISTANSEKQTKKHSLVKANQIKQTYTVVKAKFKRDDDRIKKKIFNKYGKKERDRTGHIFHKVSNKITKGETGVILEDLTGIGDNFTKKKNKPKKIRKRAGRWAWRKVQDMVEQKAQWKGLPVKVVRPHYTSSTCHSCGSEVRHDHDHRLVACTKCHNVADRDINASINILHRGLRFKPFAAPSEAMVPSSGTVRPKPFEGRGADGVECMNVG